MVARLDGLVCGVHPHLAGFGGEGGALGLVLRTCFDMDGDGMVGVMEMSSVLTKCMAWAPGRCSCFHPGSLIGAAGCLIGAAGFLMGVAESLVSAAGSQLGSWQVHLGS
jgi:hypothetical protein